MALTANEQHWIDGWGPNSHAKGRRCLCTAGKFRWGSPHGEIVHETGCIALDPPPPEPVPEPPARNRAGVRIGTFRDSA